MFFFSSIIISFAVDFDLATLEEKIAANPHHLNNRLLLAVYQLDFNNDLEKAFSLIEEVLEIDPNNENALFLKSKLSAAKQTIDIAVQYDKYSDITPDDVQVSSQQVPVAGANKPLDTSGEISLEDKKILDKYNITDFRDADVVYQAIVRLYNNMQYEDIHTLFAVLDRIEASLSDEVLLIIEQLNLLEGEQGKKEQTFYTQKDFSDQNNLETLAGTLFSMGEYQRALEIYENLFTTTSKLEFGLKLIDIYLQLGEFEKAEMTIYVLKGLNGSKAELEQYEERLSQNRQSKLEKTKQEYNQSPDLDNFKKYISALVDEQKNEKLDELVKGFLLANMQDKDAKVNLAVFLAGLGRFTESIAILYSMESMNDPAVKLLLGKTLYWDMQYEKSLNYINEVLEQNPGTDFEVQARKTLAYFNVWQGEKEKALKIFNEILEKSPDDEDVQEELLVLNREVRPLIEKYEALYQEDPKNDLYKYKLARFYSVDGNVDKSIYYYKLYSANHPEDLNIYKALSNLALLKKDYISAFSFLEYYSRKKGDLDSLFTLAKTYYQAGFSQQSVEVLDELLEKQEDYAFAIKLKNEIEIKNEVAKAKSKIIQTTFQLPDVSAKRLKSKYAKQLAQAEKLYADGFFKASLPYFQIYLVNENEDNEIRYRYALALEKSGRHEEAAGELSLMIDVTKDTDIQYHFAYNLEKTGRIEEAQKNYQLVMSEQPRELPNYLDKFLKIWAGLWERKDFDLFSSLYSKEIRENKEWRESKIASFTTRKPITVTLSDSSIMFERGGRKLIKFYQDFESENEKEKGYKILELECDIDEECYIISEKFIEGDQKSLDTSIFELARLRTKELEDAQQEDILEESAKLPLAGSMLEPHPLGPETDQEAFTSIEDECKPEDDCSKPEKLIPVNKSSVIEGSVFAVAQQRIAQIGSGRRDSPFDSFSQKKKELGALSSVLNQATPPYGFENYFYPELLSTSSVNIGPLKLMSSAEFLLDGTKSLKDLFIDEAENLIFTRIAGVKWYWYRNAADTRFNNIAVYYETPVESIGIDAKMEAGWFTIEDEENQEAGSYLHLSAAKYNLELGAQFYSFAEFSQINPYARYRYALDQHALEAIFYRRNAALIAKYSTCPIRKRIDGYNLQINDYVALEEGNYFWGAVDFTYFTDANFAVTPQFNFYFHNGLVGLLEYKYLLFGWYNFNTQTTDCYYSPTSYDSTWFGVELDYRVTHSFSILGKAGIGYSLSDNTSLYQVGGWFEYVLANGLYAKAGCSKHNSQQNTALSTVFDYEECEAKIEYRW
jgi:tetratricopeptide (TPR) repeat protein